MSNEEKCCKVVKCCPEAVCKTENGKCVCENCKCPNCECKNPDAKCCLEDNRECKKESTCK